jgi:hypothetical protein
MHLAMRAWTGRHSEAAEVSEKAARHVADALPTGNYANWRRSTSLHELARAHQVDGQVQRAVEPLEYV